MTGSCCTPDPGRGPAGSAPSPIRAAVAAPGDFLADDLIELAGGRFTMGTDAGYGYPADGEGPAHTVLLSPFAISRHAVTNAQFGAFIKATGYVTEAERFGWSFVFGGLLPEDFPPTQASAEAPWWRAVQGATWDHPEGPHSSLESGAGSERAASSQPIAGGDAAAPSQAHPASQSRWDHPAIHVSWNDAQAFCAWSAARLPTEAEWEFAARAGRAGEPFPWGHELTPGAAHRMNVFQGEFPGGNTGADGFLGTAPVDAFAPNALGLFNMTGNVWEWTQDWFHPRTYFARAAETSGTVEVAATNPRGPVRGQQRVMRGGSYLCHASYCNRYRVDARSSNTPDASTGNIGFRVARGA